MMRSNTKSKPLVIIQCYEDRQQTLPLRKTETTTLDKVCRDQVQQKREATDNPPPPLPPPMPSLNGHQNGESKTKSQEEKIISKLVSQEVKKNYIQKNGTITRTPTPDYNNKVDSLQLKNGKDEKAELESLESYKLKNPANVPAKPPSNYFMKAPNGTATMKKIARPVSVTIGEYAYNGNGRREPTKLDFLSCDRTDGPNAACDDEVSISNRLQSELALTLSRSNLRKKTEALADTGR